MKICNKCNKTFSDEEVFCDACGTKLSYVKGHTDADVNTGSSKRKKVTKTTIVLSVFLAVSVLAVIALCIKNNDTFSTLNYVQGRKDRLWEEVEEYKKKIPKLEEELNFYHTYIGLVVTDVNNYYHRHDCEDFEKGNSFKGYNINKAEIEGYTACPKCFGGE